MWKNFLLIPKYRRLLFETLTMDTPKYSRQTKRRGSRTPFNPLKSLDNSMDIEHIGKPSENTEECGIKIRTENFEDFYTVEDACGR